MEKKSKLVKYSLITIVLIIVLIIGIAIGVAFGNKNHSKAESKPTTSANVTVEQAKDIALKDAKKDFKKDVSLDSDIYVELDREDGIDVYEVSFCLKGTCYDYKIATEDGKIVDKDSELLTNPTEGISIEQAKDIALKDAKKDFKKEASLDTDIYVELDREDGIDVYEVSFYLNGVSYDYKIAISDGKIIDKDRELVTNQNSVTTNGTNKNKGIEQGKQLVLKDALLKDGQVTFTEQKQDIENGKAVFEFKFYTSTKEYEYEVDATTLEILEKEVELKNKAVGGNKNITQEEAKNIALKDSKLSEKEITIKKIELEVESNYKAYEVDFYKGNKEYDYEIDIASGTILKLSWKLK